jgi:hypothetical protein
LRGHQAARRFASNHLDDPAARSMPGFEHEALHYLAHYRQRSNIPLGTIVKMTRSDN